MVSLEAGSTAAQQAAAEPPVIVYDGECPFCSAYVRVVRLRRTFGAVRLVDARSNDPVVAEINAAGLDLDKGMVLKFGGELHYGADCIHRIALMSTSSGLFNQITKTIFASPRLTRWIYPFLAAIRNATLFCLGRRKINDPTELRS